MSARKATARSAWLVGLALMAFTAPDLGRGVPAGAATATGWTRMASLAIEHAGMGTATGNDGRFYVIGGQGEGGDQLAQVEAYNPKTNAWVTVAPLPTARSYLAAATGRDGRIYAIGGREFGPSFNFVAMSEVAVYTPSSNTWATVAPLPSPRSFLAAAVDSDGRIYAIGGRDDTGATLSDVDVYSPTTNTWTAVAGLPTARQRLAAIRGADGRIYAIGGDLGSNGCSNATSEVDAYSPGTNRWTAVASLPRPRWGTAATVSLDGRIFSIGGGGPDCQGPWDEVDVYSAATNTWSSAAPMLSGRSELGAATDQRGFIYAIAGDNGNPTNEMDVLATLSLVVGPAIAAIGPSVALPLFTLSATLSVGPLSIANDLVSFSAAGTPLCSARTNARGVASCSVLGSPASLAAITHLGYEATNNGDGHFGRTTTHAPLLTIAGTAIA